MLPALLVLALTTSASTKLGVYVSGSADPATALLGGSACPAVAVFPLPGDGSAASQVSGLRAACQTSIVFQVGGTGSALSALVATQGTDWSQTWQPQLTAAGARSGDWVEGPTEIAGGSATDLASYWTGFATAVSLSGNGLHPVVGGLAPGAPPTVTLDGGATEPVFCETLRRMGTSGVATWAWSQHALAGTLDQSAQNAALEYRTIAAQCAANGAPAGANIFLTQAGRTTGAWQTSDLIWLAWFDGQLAQDPAVLGAALFEAGGSDRSLAPIATQLEAYLQNAAPSDGGTDGGADGGTDGGTPGGTTANSHGAPGGLGNGPGASSCATAGAGFALLALLPPLFLARRRRR